MSLLRQVECKQAFIRRTILLKYEIVDISGLRLTVFYDKRLQILKTGLSMHSSVAIYCKVFDYKSRDMFVFHTLGVS